MLAIALGFFDGVHRGHATLLRSVSATAAARGLESAALTFTRHPSEMLGRPVLLLNTLSDRLRLIAAQGVRPIAIEFNEQLMSMEPLQFLQYLKSALNVTHVAAGYNYHFGRGARAASVQLRDMTAQLGMTCEILPEVTSFGEKVSSSVIRRLVSTGSISEANRLLGHAHVMTAVVEHGRGLGATIGVPTANMRLDPCLVTPRYGVYETRATLDGRVYAAVTNVGLRPTAADATDTPVVETHIIGLCEACYGKMVKLEFISYVRPEQKFQDMRELAAQIRRDVAAVQELNHSSGLT